MGRPLHSRPIHWGHAGKSRAVRRPEARELGDSLSRSTVTGRRPSIAVAGRHETICRRAHDRRRYALRGHLYRGGVTPSADPISSLQATTKQYTDRRLRCAPATRLTGCCPRSDPMVSRRSSNKKLRLYRRCWLRCACLGFADRVLSSRRIPLFNSGRDESAYVVSQSYRAAAGRGTLTGNVSLPTAPTQSVHVTNKQYVDNQLCGTCCPCKGVAQGRTSAIRRSFAPAQCSHKTICGRKSDRDRVINVAMPPTCAALNGVTDDTAAFKAAYQAAPAGSAIYVPFGVTSVQRREAGGCRNDQEGRSGSIDGTTLTDGTPLAQAFRPVASPPILCCRVSLWKYAGRLQRVPELSQSTDLAVQQSSYVRLPIMVGLAPYCKSASGHDSLFGSTANFVWGGLDRLIWAGNSDPRGRGRRSARSTLHTDTAAEREPGSNGS